MLSDFEQQFQTTLRRKISAGSRSLVQIATGAQDQTGVLVGIRSAEPLPIDFGSVRPEIAPGVTVPRRVVRLRCYVECLFVAEDSSQDRSQLMLLFDQILYALDDADIRNAEAFTSADTDPGFLIRSAALEPMDIPLAIHAVEPQRLKISVSVDGWFWPVGAVGEAGVEIGEVRIRGVVHPVVLVPQDPVSIANGPSIDLTVNFDVRGTAVISDDELANDAFGNIIARLEKDDGTVGEGTLNGGADAGGGARLLTVDNASVSFAYTPPAAAGQDILVLNVEDNQAGPGIEIGRFAINTRAAS